MNDKKKFLLELADLMDKYNVDFELSGYSSDCHLDINFNGNEFNYLSFEGSYMVEPPDIRQKAEEL